MRHSADPVDFPDIARKVCDEVLSARAQRGILVCGTGVGACIAGNKVRGIRAALCHDTYSAHQCVEHDDVNLLCMGAWIIGPKVAEEILSSYLNATFSTDEDFRRRVRKLGEMEQRCVRYTFAITFSKAVSDVSVEYALPLSGRASAFPA